MHPVYWLAACALLVATRLGVGLGQPAAVVAATIVFVCGGMPHGAYDIALLRQAVRIDRRAMLLAVGCYGAIAIAMATLWAWLPLAALIVFLVTSAVHFGEDWVMLDDPLLRFAAGAAVIAAPAIGHPGDVSALFIAMSDARAQIIAQIIVAAAPVALLVTAVGILIAWRDGSRQWAAAMALCLGLLIVLPPVAGFALFFVFLHSPRHLVQTRFLLKTWPLSQWLMTGLAISGVAIVGWIGLQHMEMPRIDATIVAQGFQLIASVALPHLLFSRWLERRLDRAVLSWPPPTMGASQSSTTGL